MKLNVVSSVLLALLVAVGFVVRSADAQADKGPNIVFFVSEDPSNYEATRTIPIFAKMLHDRYGCQCTVLEGEGEPSAFKFPGMKKAVETADLLVIFFRRRALSTEQFGLIRKHLAAGKPLVGIRTANHAFSVHGDVAAGHEKWWEFVPEVLGCGNHGYGPSKPGLDVAVVPEAAEHPVLAGVKPLKWHSNGPLYLVKPIDKKATALLTGSVGDKIEPVAWTRDCKGARVFYTSLGYPTDFDLPQFRTLLTNGIYWAMNRPVPEAR